MVGYHITASQLRRLAEMLRKGYRIYSLRFDHLEGHLTVAVKVRRGSRYFFIGQRGELLK